MPDTPSPIFIVVMNTRLLKRWKCVEEGVSDFARDKLLASVMSRHPFVVLFVDPWCGVWSNSDGSSIQRTAFFACILFWLEIQAGWDLHQSIWAQFQWGKIQSHNMVYFRLDDPAIFRLLLLSLSPLFREVLIPDPVNDPSIAKFYTRSPFPMLWSPIPCFWSRSQTKFRGLIPDPTYHVTNL